MKTRRREAVASYHRRLTRRIVVLAEQAEVRQDDGLCSALMLCAAAARDSSTARAVYLASRVCRLDHLHTCRGKEHLGRLQGLIPDDEKRRLLGQDPGGGGASALTGGAGGSDLAPLSLEEGLVESHAAYEHREYGQDTRPLAALLLAHSKAMEGKGLGSMWAGRYNCGYLCANSLRYMEAFNVPKKENMAIPGLSGVEAGLAPEGRKREDFPEEEGKSGNQLRKQHKFRMKQIMGGDDLIRRKDDMPSFFDSFDADPAEVEREERVRLMSGGEGDPQNERFEALAGGGGGAVSGSRDWLNDKLFDDDDRQRMERPTNKTLRSLYFFQYAFHVR